MKKLISVVLAFALITCGVVYYTNENNAYAVSASSNEKQLLARAVNGERSVSFYTTGCTVEEMKEILNQLCLAKVIAG